LKLAKGKNKSRFRVLSAVFLFVFVLTAAGCLVNNVQGENLQGSSKLARPSAMLIPTDDPSQFYFQDHVAVLADSGVWSVGVDDLAAVQLSTSWVQKDYWVAVDDLSPDGEKYAYVAGMDSLGGVFEPVLIILDLEKKTTILELPLAGKFHKPKDAPEPEEYWKTFDIQIAMTREGSLAWSPDGRLLAFIATIDGGSADVYLYDLLDSSVTRLSDEEHQATRVHWSPDGRYLEFMTVAGFGTGAGDNLDALWTIDLDTRQVRLLEELNSGTEWFIAWIDLDTFMIQSSTAACGNHNLRTINVESSRQKVLVKHCVFTTAFDPEQQIGMLSIFDSYCPCGDLPEPGLYTFGVDQLLNRISDLEPTWIGYLPEIGAFVTSEGILQHNGEFLQIPHEAESRERFIFPAPTGDYSAWTNPFAKDEYYGGLWMTKNNKKPIEVTPAIVKQLAWSDDGLTLFYIEGNMLYKASAPDFAPQEVPGVTGELLDVVN